MTDIHVICQHKMNWAKLQDGLFEAGEWVVSDDTADELKQTRGRIYLHEKQKERAWHGGAVLDWKPSPGDSKRKIFPYSVDGPFRSICPGSWSREIAIVRE
ncbi:hypothetical protein MESS2_130033 [Mesorhizobium metallidurans STM 2683]|uniref:Uncharacterized protein n=1 Tax=Mesorhizobium metallidurans STM 2683 TaxID=1297569 RepID=M5EY06_9HYPH|nr:hypothetical protein MESS2_130033 [Mesorhizobium metallidurans STM 2683]